MTIAPRINMTPGCERPANCRSRAGGLCARCSVRRPAAPTVATAATASHVIRIELTGAHRRILGEMAREAGISADTLASQLLAAVIDDDAAAHGGKL